MKCPSDCLLVLEENRTSSTAALNPLDLKEPYVRVIPDWRIHVAAGTRGKANQTQASKVDSTLVGPARKKLCLFLQRGVLRRLMG